LKIGFLGGAFDPVHLGHLVMAQDAVEQLQLDRLDFVPAAVSPWKERTMVASAPDRLEMVRRAIVGDSRFGVCDLEIQRGGLSYTVDTARELRKRHPDDRLYWVIGADHLVRLDRWHEVATLVQLIEFAQVERPGCEGMAPPVVAGLRLHRVRSHLIEVSSTELRDRVAHHQGLRYLVPPVVAAYIAEQSLYRNSA